MDLKGNGRRVIWKYWYPYLTQLANDTPLPFLNYGYVDAHTLTLLPVDEPDRLNIQLYHHVAAAVDLTGQDMLEVSCGHGGGASYVARYLHPRSMVGVDRNPRAIQFCRKHHAVQNLSFVEGDAESLHFDDHTFDAILNLEASHCYGRMPRFLQEIRRVLRPGGYFLFADFRTPAEYTRLNAQLLQAGLEIIQTEDITPQVLRAMEIDDQAKRHLIQQLVPRLLQRLVAQFAGVKGSGIFERFQTGELIYFRYLLRTPTRPV